MYGSYNSIRTPLSPLLRTSLGNLQTRTRSRQYRKTSSWQLYWLSHFCTHTCNGPASQTGRTVKSFNTSRPCLNLPTNWRDGAQVGHEVLLCSDAPSSWCTSFLGYRMEDSSSYRFVAVFKCMMLSPQSITHTVATRRNVSTVPWSNDCVTTFQRSRKTGTLTCYR